MIWSPTPGNCARIQLRRLNGFAPCSSTSDTDEPIARGLPGHRRAETTRDAIIPVPVLDVTAEEADKLLLTSSRWPRSQKPTLNVI